MVTLRVDVRIAINAATAAAACTDETTENVTTDDWVCIRRTGPFENWS
jgi:hypothetical protein